MTPGYLLRQTLALLPQVEPVHYCPLIHGSDGLGDLDPPLPASARRLDPRHAVTLIVDTLRASEGRGEQLTLIALAPLTNVAMALRLEPELCRRALGRVVWMGGAAFAGGNASQWAEANAAYDPEAAHILLTSGVEVLMYTWDVYLEVDFSWRELLELGCAAQSAGDDAGAEEAEPEPPPDGVGVAEGAPSWSAASTRLLLRDMRHWGAPAAQIGDAGAVAAVVRPDAVTTRRMHVAVEMRGELTRGMTVVDPRAEVTEPDRPKAEPNVEVCVCVDAAAIKQVFAAAVLERASEAARL